MLPAILGITAAAILAVTACFCARRAQNKKTNTDTSTLPFQPPRRSTAVRSPSGQPTHYLKKSPSPTGATKPLPGLLLTPSDALPPTPIGGGSPTPPSANGCTTKYTEENEVNISKNGELRGDGSNGHHHEIDTPVDRLDEHLEYGKLGSLVFKLRYLADRNALVVSVVRCRGLPSKPIANGCAAGAIAAGGDLPTGSNGKVQNATDPYVKLQLLPEKQHKVKTRYKAEYSDAQEHKYT